MRLSCARRWFAELRHAENLLSVSRIPLAGAFIVAARSTYASLAILAMAGLTDILDGWFARRSGRVSGTGAIIDGIADKCFAFCVLGTLVVRGTASPVQALMLAVRELGEMPLALHMIAKRKRHPIAIETYRANPLGKVATCIEFVTIVLLILQHPASGPCVALTAALGAIAAVSYWTRALRCPSAPHSDAPAPALSRSHSR